MAPLYRILALDVDGTLLDRDGTLRPRTAEAVVHPVELLDESYRLAGYYSGDDAARPENGDP